MPFVPVPCMHGNHAPTNQPTGGGPIEPYKDFTAEYRVQIHSLRSPECNLYQIIFQTVFADDCLMISQQEKKMPTWTMNRRKVRFLVSVLCNIKRITNHFTLLSVFLQISASSLLSNTVE